MNKVVKKKVVLIVEDEIALQEALKLKFEKAGLEVFTADTGEDALTILGKISPDLITLDILLPKMNGMEVLKIIREDEKMKDLRVVVLSVSGGQDKIKEAFALGVEDYIVKSEYKIEKIVKRLLGFIKNSQKK